MIEAVLFDIDGTLLVTGGAGGAAWQRAFEELHGVEANIEEHTDAGMTDPEIAEIVFREVIGREGIRGRARARRSPATSSHLPDAVAESDGYRVMPGIEELLDRLVESGTLLGIVTGNIEAAAHIKLARGDLNRFFSLRRLRLRLPRPHRADQEARSSAASWVAGGTLSSSSLRRRSGTPPATSRPATAPGSRSSASPPAATRRGIAPSWSRFLLGEPRKDFPPDAPTQAHAAAW